MLVTTKKKKSRSKTDNLLDSVACRHIECLAASSKRLIHISGSLWHGSERVKHYCKNKSGLQNWCAAPTCLNTKGIFGYKWKLLQISAFFLALSVTKQMLVLLVSCTNGAVNSKDLQCKLPCNAFTSSVWFHEPHKWKK